MMRPWEHTRAPPRFWPAPWRRGYFKQNGEPPPEMHFPERMAGKKKGARKILRLIRKKEAD